MVITTPNREYNVWENVGPETSFFRHPDHRLRNGARSEFSMWAEAMAGRYGYNVRFLPVEASERGRWAADADGGVRTDWRLAIGQFP